MSTAPNPSKARPTTDMPAGDARRDQERINADALAEAAEQGANADVHAINPAKLEPINEIVGRIVNDRFNQLEVSGRLPEYRYAWVRAFLPSGAYDQREVQIKQLARIRDPKTGHLTPCWEVVCGDMPEGRECKDVHGYRRLGDTILMRCREDYARELDRMEAEDRARAEGKLFEEFEDRANRESDGRFKVSQFMGQRPRDWARSRAQSRGLARAAVLAPGGEFERHARAGTLPGVPVPGR